MEAGARRQGSWRGSESARGSAPPPFAPPALRGARGGEGRSGVGGRGPQQGAVDQPPCKATDRLRAEAAATPTSPQHALAGPGRERPHTLSTPRHCEIAGSGSRWVAQTLEPLLPIIPLRFAPLAYGREERLSCGHRGEWISGILVCADPAGGRIPVRPARGPVAGLAPLAACDLPWITDPTSQTAFWAAGVRVRGTVRSTSNASKVGHLRAWSQRDPGKLELVEVGPAPSRRRWSPLSAH